MSYDPGATKKMGVWSEARENNSKNEVKKTGSERNRWREVSDWLFEGRGPRIMGRKKLIRNIERNYRLFDNVYGLMASEMAGFAFAV